MKRLHVGQMLILTALGLLVVVGSWRVLQSPQRERDAAIQTCVNTLLSAREPSGSRVTNRDRADTRTYCADTRLAGDWALYALPFGVAIAGFALLLGVPIALLVGWWRWFGHRQDPA